MESHDLYQDITEGQISMWTYEPTLQTSSLTQNITSVEIHSCETILIPDSSRNNPSLSQYEDTSMYMRTNQVPVSPSFIGSRDPKAKLLWP